MGSVSQGVSQFNHQTLVSHNSLSKICPVLETTLNPYIGIGAGEERVGMCVDFFNKIR